MPSAETLAGERSSPWSLFVTFLRLGLTSFGGPVAHIGYFRNEFVGRRRWLDEGTFADLVALCQFLPGPASSQVGLAIGTLRGGKAGALAAWLGFTLPSAVLMILFGYGVAAAQDAAGSGWLVGLKAMAVAIVAQAVWDMGRTLCPDGPTKSLAVGSAMLVVLWPLVLPFAAGAQVAAIVLGGLAGWLLPIAVTIRDHQAHPMPISRRFAVASASVFVLLIAGLPVLTIVSNDSLIAVIDGFYRSGSLVFGGGHVLLPLLEAVVVEPGWVSAEQFLAGYGAAQALPGPLFTFSAYLGTVMTAGPGGWIGGTVCVVVIFLPSFLLVFAAMPFWNVLRSRAGVRSILAGVNASVVGLLLAALYDPVWTATVRGPKEFALVLLAFAMLTIGRRSPRQVAIVAALVGAFAFG